MTSSSTAFFTACSTSTGTVHQWVSSAAGITSTVAPSARPA